MPRRTVYEVIEGGGRRGRAGRIYDGLEIALIVLSVTAALLSTDADLGVRYGWLFTAVDGGSGLAFTLEYLLRIWVCVDDRRGRYNQPLAGRLRYMLTPVSLIDLLAILPFWLATAPDISIEQLWLLRALRVLKLQRYSSALETLGTVIRNERRPLTASGTLMMSLLVLLSSLIYLAEREAQPDRFGSVPEAMWWGIVTLATVGYGDVVPITLTGRIIGGVAVVLGMGMFALPAGILANGFAEEMRRRNFVVTWNLVASVPFFEKLAASRIAAIAAMLTSQVASPSEILVRQGDQADCMYFIVSGEVEVRLPNTSVRLHSGDFFGEIALLTDSVRTATVAALTSCQLLVLRVDDFRKVLAAHPDLRETIARVAEQRLSAPVTEREGSHG